MRPSQPTFLTSLFLAFLAITAPGWAQNHVLVNTNTVYVVEDAEVLDVLTAEAQAAATAAQAAQTAAETARDEAAATAAALEAIVYVPNQSLFAGSLALGDGLRNLERVAGEQGRDNVVTGLNGTGSSLTTGWANILYGSNVGSALGSHLTHPSFDPAASIGNVGNVLIGRNVAPVADGALDNTGVGTNVFLNLTNGMDNAAFGINSLRDIQSGSEDVAYGHGSLQHIVGSGTIASGTGHRLSAFGDMAGRFLNSGAPKLGGMMSVYIGARTTSLDSVSIQENVIGYAAEGRGSYSMTFGSSAITGHYFPTGSIYTEGHVTTTAFPNAHIDSTTGQLRRSTSVITPGALPATAANDNAPAGALGEYVSASVAIGSPVALTTGNAATITSITLTAGDWDVSGMVGFTGNVATTVTYLRGGISAADNTLPSATEMESRHGYGSAIFSVNNVNMTVPSVRISLSTTTTIYLVSQAYFTVNTCSGFGKLEARRAR